MKRAILVEGAGDKEFVISFLGKIGIADFECLPPRELTGPSNGIDNVIKILPVFLKNIQAGTYDKAAIFIDADHQLSGNAGFSHRRSQITKPLADAGYTIPVNPPAVGVGEVFSNANGLIDIGLFIAPDHGGDGMLEDMLKSMVTSQAPHAALMTHACQTIAQLPTKLFNEQIHTSKAELNTFLAWQRKPPARYGNCITDSIFDISTPSAQKLAAWFKSALI